MSISECIDNAVKGKELTQEEGVALKAQYDRLKARRDSQGDAAAGQSAKDELAQELRVEAIERERRVRLQAQVQQRLEADLDAYRSPKGEQDLGEAAVAVLEHYGSAPYSSVAGREKSIIGLAHARMEQMLARFERSAVSGLTPDRADLDNVVREALGEASGDGKAAELARVWGDTAEWLRQRFNAAGGNIAKLENWGLPQIHDARALNKAGREAWKARIMPLLDVSRMRRGEAGTPITVRELDEILDDIHDSITTDGWSKREAQQRPFGSGALATQRTEHRFLIFKSADAWLEYQRDFGQGNPFAAMMGHVNLMARDISALEILGPNPNATMAWLEQTVTKEAALKHAGKKARFAGGRNGAKSRGSRKVRTLQHMWDHMRAGAQTPVTEGSANFFAGMRNWVTSSVLGSAVLSAVPTDPVYQAMARKAAGIPAIKTLSDIARQFSGAKRHEAVRAGLILDTAMHTFGTNARYLGTLSGPQWSQWLADRTLTASGLTPWTQAGRHSFGMAFMGEMAERAAQAFDDLHPALKKTMTNYGITPEDWDVMRKVKLYEPETGATFLRPHDIASVDEGVAGKVLEMVLSETEYAVPSSTTRGKAWMIGQEQPGTLWGEIKRSASMFKSFGTTFALLYGGRALQEFGVSKARGAGYVGAILTTTMLGGALSKWLKDVSAGRDPQSVFDENGNPLKFMGAALLQGGGLGIYGDFLFADLNRYGGGIAGTLTGPVIETGNEAINLTIGNIVQMAAGEDTNAVEELRQFADGMIPGQSVWWLKLGYDRAVMDQIEYLVDPKAHQQFRRRIKYWQNEHGTDMWWRPGEMTPDRAPDLGLGR